MRLTVRPVRHELRAPLRAAWGELRVREPQGRIAADRLKTGQGRGVARFSSAQQILGPILLLFEVEAERGKSALGHHDPLFNALASASS